MMTRFHPASNPDFMPLETLRELQWSRFQKILRHTWQNVPWYREKLKSYDVKIDDIKSLDDIHKLPFIIKTDLRDTYPFGMFAVPMSQIVRVHASSGTTGKPIVVAYTKEDLEVWDEVISRSLANFNVSDRDILQNSFGYGLFTGGLGLHCGAQFHGVTVIPMSGGNTERQIMLMRDFNVSVISCTPSYFVHLIDAAQKMGVDIKELNLKTGIFGAEPWTEEMRKTIEREAGIKAYDIYGLTEIIGPGVGAECSHQVGPHIFEDHFYPEIIDPQTLKPLPDGEWGELVFTTLNKWAMPLIRYRTRDITRIHTEPCPCGRTIRRIDRISHRSDDMFIIRGVNVFPGQIESALLAIEGVLPHYQIILTRYNGLDNIEVQVELSPNQFDDTLRSIEAVQKMITEKIQHTIGIRVKVQLVEPNRIPRSEGKAKRIIDQRS
ncbi:MAG: phenylacetate--CoA ligase [Planctomycetia bacterium]|nr:phenylacetate--CoA ligase [Planctomycetia bacterium]